MPEKYKGERLRTWTPATKRAKVESVRAAPVPIFTRVAFDVSAVIPADIRQIVFANNPVSRAANPAAIMADGGIDGCDLWQTMRPM